MKHFKLLHQMEICRTQLEEFALYFHVPVRELECFSVKQGLKTELGSPEYSIALYTPTTTPNKTKLENKENNNKKKKKEKSKHFYLPPSHQTEIKQSKHAGCTHTTEKLKGKAGPELFPSYLPPSFSYSSHNSPGLLALTARESPSCPDTAWLKLPQHQGL